MAQYIDKDALVAEIERRNEESWLGSYTKEKGIAFDITEDILSFINTLEVKEVDLDEYYHKFLKKEWFGKNCCRTISEMMAFTAKHFFELGLKVAQKGEEV